MSGGDIMWFAVRIRPQQRTVTGGSYADPSDAPFVVERMLQRRGFQTYLPSRTVWRFRNGVAAVKRKKEKVRRPLLVGWIFVGWPRGENRWRALLDCDHVQGVAGADGKPWQISTAVMEAFAKRNANVLAAPDRERFMPSRAEYAPGQNVRVLVEPYAGFVGKVVGVTGAQARVLLPLFGMDREIAIDAAMVEAA